MTFAQLDVATDLTALPRLRGQGRLPHWIGGREHPSPAGSPFQAVTCPWDGAVLGEVPLGGAAEVAAAAVAAERAFPGWRDANVRERAQVMFRFKRLLEEEIDELARGISGENGKTFAEAKAEVMKGIEVVEFASALPHLAPGRIAEVSGGIDCMVTKEPLGVVASVTPFNFPAMVPLWFLPFAVVCGNTFVLKPSEQVPLSQKRIFELLEKCGLPPGVVNLVNGGREVVSMLPAGV